MPVSVPHDDALLRARLDAAPTPFDLLARSAAARPDHPAIEYLPDGSGTPPLKLSYAQLLAAVEAAAAAFQAAGVGAEDGVAILLPFVPQAVPALIAAISVGVAFPMNLLLSAEAIGPQLALARTKVVVSMGPHPALDVRARVAAALKFAPGVATVVEVPLTSATPGATLWDEFLRAGAGRPIAPGAPERVAALVHTGGTMGAPKLAQLSQRNLAAGALMAAGGFGWRADDRLITGLPLFHVGGAVDVLLSALAAGATVILPTALGMRNPEVVGRFWNIVDETAATIVGGVPTSLAAIAASPRGTSGLDTLRALVTGGSSLPAELAARIEALSGRPVYQLYGMTESAGIATAQLTDGRFREPLAGRPVPMARIGIGSADGPFQPGARGEVFVGGPHVFQGYRTERGTVDRPAGGWVASGDLGEVQASGELKIVGRVKDVIIRSGHNIDPLLIEDVALQHPAVAQAAAIAMPDAYAGELPTLYVVLRAGAGASVEDIGAFVNARVAEPPARPKQVFILPELPLTPVGKIARYRLRQLAVEYRARLALDGLVAPEAVSCTDAAAKRITIDSPAATPERRRQIGDALAALGLELAIRE